MADHSANPDTGASAATPPTLTIDVYSDYTCPWCYIGSERLKQLRERVAGRIELAVEWHPFEIHPEVPAEGMPVERLGYPPAQWEAMMNALRQQAEAEGLELGNRPKVSNTHRALAAGAYAQAEEPARFPAFHDALFRAYFTEGRDIGDPAVIRAVAGAAGLDVERMEAALEGGEYEAALAETTRLARRQGITGTPTYVFADRLAVVGARPTDVLERVAERALEEEGPGAPDR